MKMFTSTRWDNHTTSTSKISFLKIGSDSPNPCQSGAIRLPAGCKKRFVPFFLQEKTGGAQWMVQHIFFVILNFSNLHPWENYLSNGSERPFRYWPTQDTLPRCRLDFPVRPTGSNCPERKKWSFTITKTFPFPRTRTVKAPFSIGELFFYLGNLGSVPIAWVTCQKGGFVHVFFHVADHSN